MNLSADGDIFNSALSTGFADVCLLRKREEKSEQQTLAFCFCVLGVKEIQRTDSAVWKIRIFCFPQSLGSALYKNVEKGCSAALAKTKKALGKVAFRALQHHSSSPGHPTRGTAPVHLWDTGSCQAVDAAKSLLPFVVMHKLCCSHSSSVGEQEPSPTSQLVPVNSPWGSQVAHPGCVGCIYTSCQTAVQVNAVGIHSAKLPNGYNSPQHISAWPEDYPWT